MLYYFSLFFILYLPFQPALNLAPGIDLASSRVLAILLFAAWLASGLKNRTLNISLDPSTPLLLSFVFLCLFSLFFAPEIFWGGKKMLFLLSFFPLYFVFSDFVRDNERAQKIARFLVYAGAIASLAAIFQFFSQFVFGLDSMLNFWRELMPSFLGQTFSQSVFGYSSWLVNIGGNTYFRAIGFFPDPHMLSLFLGLIFPWSIALAIQEKTLRKNNSLLFWISAGLILMADLFTFSRGGYLGLCGGFLFLGYQLIKKYRQKYTPYFLIFALILLGIIFIPNPLGQRFFTSLNPAEGSNRERLKNWSEAVQIIHNHPLTGTGLGNYSLAVKPTAEYREPIYAHNLYLDIAAETGILNALIFGALLLSAILAFWKKSGQAIFNLGGSAGLIIFAGHSLFESGLYSVQVLPLLMIILALSTNSQKNAL